MKITLNIVGALLVLFGAIWFLQGINVLPGSFMSGRCNGPCAAGSRLRRESCCFLLARVKDNGRDAHQASPAGSLRTPPAFEVPRGAGTFRCHLVSFALQAAHLRSAADAVVGFRGWIRFSS
jgi:hypothetical protein